MAAMRNRVRTRNVSSTTRIPSGDKDFTMAIQSSRSAVGSEPRPLFPTLMTFPAACFVGTLLTDLAYIKTAEMPWESFSIWLLTAGLVFAGITVVIGLVQAFGQHRWPTRTQMIGYALVLILSLFNAFIHSRDGWTSVVPEGVTLSAVVTLLLIVMAWFDWRAAGGRRYSVAA
jgi:uncharacterized membrane protein